MTRAKSGRFTRRRPRTRYDGGRPRRRRGRMRGGFRRHKDKHIPIIATAGALGSFFVNQPQYNSPGSWIVNTLTGQHPNLMDTNTVSGSGMADFAGDLMVDYLGYDPRRGTWGLPTGTLMVLGSALASKLVTRVAGNPFAKLPWVGKYVKF